MRPLVIAAVFASVAIGCLVVTDDFGGKACTKAADCPAVAGYGCFSKAAWPQVACGENEKGCACELLFPPPSEGYGDGGSDAGALDYCRDVKPLLTKQCLYTCHSITQRRYIGPDNIPSPQDFQLETWFPIMYSDGGMLNGVESQRAKIHTEVYTKRDMPPPDFPQATWHPADTDKIHRWYLQGAGLGDGGCEFDAGHPENDGGMVSFSADLEPMFMRNCGCHESAPFPGDLDLRPGFAYANLVNKQVSSGCLMGAAVRVQPNDTMGSMLWKKTANYPGHCNDFMPPPDAGGPLRSAATQHDFDLLEAWINQGAADN